MVDLDYLVDNGRLYGWQTDTVPARLVRWLDDGTYTVQDAQGKPLGSGDTPDEAWQEARLVLTERRRKADGVTPARVC